MSFKIAHVSDIHIRKLKYHTEYRAVFTQLYDELRELKPDIIVNTGDTFHTKLDLSPEAVCLISELLTNLAEIAPVHNILGNHDMNLKNSARLDALSPIVDNLNNPNVHLHKYSAVVPVAENIDLHVLSIVDPENWSTELPDNKVNIALHHGGVAGVETDTGWVMTHGDISIDTLEKFDYALLGDIHKTHQKVDADGKCAYPGSLVTQNFGETNDKGYLLWDIEDKDNFTCTHTQITNPKPFITIELTPKGRMPKNTEIPRGARLRLVSNNNLPLHTMRRAMDVAKHRFKPESISFLNRAMGERGSASELTDTLKTEELRNIEVQEELMAEYLKEYQAPAETMDEIHNLNRKYNKLVEENEEVLRNVRWKLKSFEWDNLFNYGENNSIDFDRLDGIVGVFGKNFSGKSSVIDAMLYTLFNTTSKNERKNLNVINQNRELGRGTLKIEVGNLLYTIERTSEKYLKRLKGEETTEAKTNLNFEVYDRITEETESLNAATRAQTDANIRKHFGSIDDFLVSSMASQHGALAFIDEGSTRRKEIIAKFLDLEFFDKKFKLAKEDSVEKKAILKKDATREFDTEISEAQEELEAHRTVVENNHIRCLTLKKQLDSAEERHRSLREQISDAPDVLVDGVTLKEERDKKSNMLAAVIDRIIEQENSLAFKTQKNDKAILFIGSTDIDKLRTQADSIETLETDIRRLNEEFEDIERKQRLLDSIPCGDGFPTCRFIKDAVVVVAGRTNAEDSLTTAAKQLEELEPEGVSKKIAQFNVVEEMSRQLEREISELKLKREKNRNIKVTLEGELETLENRIEEFTQNKEFIENLEKIIREKKSVEKSITEKKAEVLECEKGTMDAIKMVGSYEQKIETLAESRDEYSRLQKEYSAYDLFLRCMHPNGIASDIVRKKIPVLNQEVAKVLANVVDFEVFFESKSDSNKLDIFIKHPRFDPRPIEMASGAEKSMAAMALRLALLSVSSLPTSNLFVLDEPGTALDQDNMEGFVRILELVKVYFKNVFLISHLDSLKDCVDMQIEIDKTGGFAKISV